MSEGGALAKLRAAIYEYAGSSRWMSSAAIDAELAAVEARIGRLVEHVLAFDAYRARHGDDDEGDGRRWKWVIATRSAITDEDMA